MTLCTLSPPLFPSPFFPEEDTPFGVSATHPALKGEKDLALPFPEEDGRIATLNQTGFMTPDQNPYTLKFFDFAAQSPCPVLDIGAAYGVSSLPALEKGATVIANDLDPRHLLLLREKVPLACHSRLILNTHSFPAETEFPDNSLSAIHACRIVHFLKAEEMETAIEKIKRWLVPQGRAFIIALSPHHRYLRDKFLPLYEERVKNNDPWPGGIDNMHLYVPHEAHKIPHFVHAMDTHSLGAAFKRHGFKVIEEALFDYPRPQPTTNEGKGYYGIIVEKPTP